MSYQVGIDLGTTYTAAAVHRDDTAAIFSLGGRAASIPSVVLLREDETILTGEAAVRRAITEPERVAREFKRRLGDTTPIIVGGSPYSAEALMARLLRSVIEEIETREGESPSQIAVSHPANWGPYKLDLFGQALRLAGLDEDTVITLTEPEAAAISYANQERVDEGQIVAVYDLGGGTFDACVLRRTAQGFEIIGKPEGIERLGGIDFDAAVFAHVARSLDGAFDDLDPDDPTTMAAVARLRADCVDAKEALSADTDATIPVLLPNLQTEVRLTRREFESVVRPSLVDSLEAMRRAVASAGVEMDQVAKVLLVGGSSRIPLVAQMVSSELGRPVAVDAHPKHAIAIGAAYAAAAAGGVAQGPTGNAAAPVGDEPLPEPPGVIPPQAPSSAPFAAPAPVDSPPPASVPPAAVTPPAMAPAPAAEPPLTPLPPPAVAAPAEPATPTPTPAPRPLAAEPPATAAPKAPMGPPPAAAERPAAPAAAASTPPISKPATVATTVRSDVATPVKSRMPLLLGVGAVALIALVGGFFALNGGDGDAETAADAGLTSSPATDESDPAETDSGTGEDASTTTEAPAEPTGPTDAEVKARVEAVIADADLSDEVSVEVSEGIVSMDATLGRTVSRELQTQIDAVDGVKARDNAALVEVEDDAWCSPDVKANERWACITSAIWNGTEVVVEYETETGGEVFNTQGGYHYHFFPSETPVKNAGGIAQGAESEGGIDGTPGWDIWDEPDGYAASRFGRVNTLCVRIANAGHALESLSSGNCWPVTDES